MKKIFLSAFLVLAVCGAARTAHCDQPTIAPMARLAIGAARVTSTGDRAAHISSMAATGGTAPYKYQWYRSVKANSLGRAIPGATALILNDEGITNGLVYYYTLKTTDGTANTEASPQIAAVPGKTFYIGLIGDSWNTMTTARESSNGIVSGAAAGNILQQKLQAIFGDGTKIIVNNQGIAGTNGSDWANGGDNLTNALASFATAHATKSDWILVIHLGINDSSISNSNPSGGESVSQYQNYIAATANALLSWGAKRVVLQGPPYIASQGSNPPNISVSLLSQYWGALQKIAATNPSRIALGVNEYPYYVDNQSDLGGDHVHLTPADSNGQGGATNLSTMWAQALHQIILSTPDRFIHHP